ncbi:plasma membrane localization protein [Tulasnella sp. JGI-2019a]|nr:plasma membrane localization protein [Tulasnella sp. JGI-2019a]KAG9034083.1 plasma membrane localization protein [Tulasnella sp. JGI-2019a]
MVLLSFTTPNHIRLVNACYPAAPLAAGPQYQPNSQELSRLTYYASNKPSKLNKVSQELEKRSKAHARRAQGGNVKYRAQLLVTLEIYRALTTECRRDLALFSGGVLASIEIALVCLPKDLEVVARAASTFTAWATYTDGTLLGVDNSLTQSYLNVLRIFSAMGTTEPEKIDEEYQSRQRLVGLASVSTAIQSDALFNTMAIFSQQVEIIVASLLETITQAELSVLTTEATAVETFSSSSTPNPFVAEFQQQRPVAQRRAPSIHVHVDGEKGPTFHDVVGTSLRALQSLVGRSNAIQVPVVLMAIFTTFDEAKEGRGWDNIEFCRWLASKITDWTQYQYRFAVPTRLLERLMNAKDAAEPTSLHFALISMITNVFTSATPLINLSTSDILSTLLNLINARLAISPTDALLQPIVDCVSSLGTHIYYADQLQDLAEQLVNRLVSVQVNGLQGRGRESSDMGREEGLRCLVACLDGLLRVADQTHPSSRPRPLISRSSDQNGRTISPPLKQHQSNGSAESSKRLQDVILSSSPLTPGGTAVVTRGRRNKVAPEVWQDTLALLCESQYHVRSAYAAALVRFLREEIDKEPFAIGTDGPESRTHRFAAMDKPVAPLASDPTVRFLNALHASVFTLALASNLGLVNNAPSSSSDTSLVDTSRPSPINIIPPTPGVELLEPPTLEVNGSTVDASAEDLTQGTVGRRSVGSQRARKASLGLTLLDLSPPNGTSLRAAPATLSDYSHVLNVLIAVHETLPARSLLTGVPMVLALDAAARGDPEKEDKAILKRKVAIREVVAKIWGVIGGIWGCAEITGLIQKEIGTAPEGSCLPVVTEGCQMHQAHKPVEFEASSMTETSILVRKAYVIDRETVLEALSQSPNVQKATGLDATSILARLSSPWSAEKAVRESTETVQDHDQYARSEGGAHLLKISPGMMSNDNKSLASIARTARGVGVEHLRDALEGRGSLSNVHLPGSGAYSFSTEGDHRPSIHGGSKDINLARLAVARDHNKNHKPLLNKPGDVADVLNKLGIGQQKPSKMLHMPLSAGSKQQDNAIIAPPYRT